MIGRVLQDLERSDPRFYAGIKKWLPLLDSTVQKVCTITGQDACDVLQDLLEGLARINAVYDVPLYRFKGSLYEKVREDRGVMCLKTMRTHRASYWFWTNKSSVERVKKSKLEFLIGLGINQKCYDLIYSHCKRRNGYRKVKSNQKVYNNWGRRVKHVCDIKKEVSFVDFDDYSHLFAYGVTPEMLMLQKQRLEFLESKLSARSFEVLSLQVADPGIRDRDVRELLSLSAGQLRGCKEELGVQVQFLRSYYDAGMF